MQHSRASGPIPDGRAPVILLASVPSRRHCRWKLRTLKGIALTSICKNFINNVLRHLISTYPVHLLVRLHFSTKLRMYVHTHTNMHTYMSHVHTKVLYYITACIHTYINTHMHAHYINSITRVLNLKS